MTDLNYDKEYLILNQIDANPEATQRELSRHTGLSLGSVNLLLKKMVREGLIKMETIPAHRVAYMLTPKGMVEKANKTVTYIKRHYHAIHQTKEAMKATINNILQEHQQVYVFQTDDEISRLVVTALDEMDATSVILINSLAEVSSSHIPILHCSVDETLETISMANPTIRLLEKL